MRPSANQLAMRDPALASFLGLIGSNGANFGADFGDDDDDDYGYEGGFGAEAPVAQAQAAKKLLNQHNQKRMLALNPNRGMKKKIERYQFSLNQTLTLGTSATLALTGSPDTEIRPQRVMINTPWAAFCELSEIRVANVAVTVGGITDASHFSPIAVAASLDMPTLTPANRASVSGSYTGYVPSGYVNAASFRLVVSFTGPASMAG